MRPTAQRDGVNDVPNLREAPRDWTLPGWHAATGGGELEWARMNLQQRMAARRRERERAKARRWQRLHDARFIRLMEQVAPTMPSLWGLLHPEKPNWTRVDGITPSQECIASMFVGNYPGDRSMVAFVDEGRDVGFSGVIRNLKLPVEAYRPNPETAKNHSQLGEE